MLDYTVNILKVQYAQETAWLQYHLGLIVLPMYSVRAICAEHRETNTYHKTHTAMEDGVVMPCFQLQLLHVYNELLQYFIVGNRFTKKNIFFFVTFFVSF